MATTPLASLVECGTKLWLDSVDPDLITENLAFGATGATSNPIIISDLVKSGRYDSELRKMIAGAKDLPQVTAWALNDRVVADAQRNFPGGTFEVFDMQGAATGGIEQDR